MRLEGVDFTTLGEICEIKTGRGITKSDAIEGGTFPIISGGKEPMGLYHDKNRKANTITISRVGAYAGFVNFITTDFYLNDKCFSVIPNTPNISPRFLYYYLKHNEEYIKRLQSKGAVPTINTVKVSNLTIPIPTLLIQEEIVRILDKFTELEKELEKELECRKKQHEHYLNNLLSFNMLNGG